MHFYIKNNRLFVEWIHGGITQEQIVFTVIKNGKYIEYPKISDLPNKGVVFMIADSRMDNLQGGWIHIQASHTSIKHPYIVLDCQRF